MPRSRISGANPYIAAVGRDLFPERASRDLAEIEARFSARSRNALLPALSLPPELLGEIFCLLRGDWIAFAAESKSGLWIPACSHVCYHWRQVALNHRSLWSLLSLRHSTVKWVDEMIRRSSPSPLTFLTTFSRENDKAHALNLLVMEQPLSSRLRTLDYVATPQAGVATFPRATLPLLQVLSIRTFHRDPVVLEGFKPSHLPSLKTLRLTNACINRNAINSEMFLNLVELHVQCAHPTSRPKPDLISDLTFDELLSHLPNVQFISLKNPFPHPLYPPKVRDEPHVVLPASLKKLSLQFDEACVGLFALLKAIIIPPSLDLHVNIFSSHGESKQLNALLGNLRPPQSLKLYFDFSFPQMVICPQVYTSAPVSDDDGAPRPLTEVIICVAGSELCAPPLTNIPLEQVTRFIFGPDPTPEPSKEWWPSVFARAPHIRELQLSVHDRLLPHALAALSGSGDKEDAAESHVDLLELERLVFIDTEKIGSKGMDDNVLTEISRCVDARIVTGYSLRELSLPERYQGDIQIEKLRERVEKLTFGDELFI